MMNPDEKNKLVLAVLDNLESVFGSESIRDITTYVDGMVRIWHVPEDEHGGLGDAIVYLLPSELFLDFEKLKESKEQYDQNVMEQRERAMEEQKQKAEEKRREEELAMLKRLKEKYPEES